MGQDCERYLDALKKCALFDGIEEEDIKQILHCLNCRITQYENNKYIVLLQQELDGVGIILRGEAAFVKETARGNRVVPFTFHAGDMFGEVLMLSQQTRWSMTVQALTACSVVFINPEKIINVCDNVCSRHKVLLTNLVRLISKKAYTQAEQISAGPKNRER